MKRRTSIAVWTLVLSLIVGIGCGLAGGSAYGADGSDPFRSYELDRDIPTSRDVLLHEQRTAATAWAGYAYSQPTPQSNHTPCVYLGALNFVGHHSFFATEAGCLPIWPGSESRRPLLAYRQVSSE